MKKKGRLVWVRYRRRRGNARYGWRLMRWFPAAALALGVAACAGSEFDRDAGACVVLARDGASCTVTIPKKEASP